MYLLVQSLQPHHIADLMKPISVEEIKTVVFQMEPLKAPWPNGTQPYSINDSGESLVNLSSLLYYLSSTQAIC